VNRERANSKKYYQTVNRLRKGYQPPLNACKNNGGKPIEGDDNILEHWVRYFKTQFERENSEEDSRESGAVYAMTN
jgi:hypothetical protein